MPFLRVQVDGGDTEVTKLLINEPALQVLPTLAERLGLNEAIAVQQLHFAVTTFEARVVEVDGHRWLRADLAWWSGQFGWWSEPTIKRIWANLRERGIVHTSRGREANVYRIDYAALDGLTDQIDPRRGSDRPVQTDQIDPSPSIGEGTTESKGESTSGADALFEVEATPPSPAPAPSQNQGDAEVDIVWQKYVAVFGVDHMRVKELTPARARDIRKAINATNVAACCDAIEGLKSYRRAHPDGSQDISLGTIFQSRPGGRNLTDQIEWWASQANTRDNAATHAAPGQGHKVPLDLSGVSAVVAGSIRARVAEVVKGLQTESEDARERGRVALDWLKEHCGWTATRTEDGRIEWSYLDD